MDMATCCNDLGKQLEELSAEFPYRAIGGLKQGTHDADQSVRSLG